MKNFSRCGTDCAACQFYGGLCKGCNESGGKPFFCEGALCPIYACAVKKQGCAGCGELPCQVWRDTRDPAMNDAEFEQSIRTRMANLNKSGE